MSASILRGDAAFMRQAVISAVRPESLVSARLSCPGRELLLDGLPLDPPAITTGRVMVVGGGKAAAAMAVAVERMLHDRIGANRAVEGLVSVPGGAGDGGEGVDIRVTRPPGVNLPTPEAVEATATMRSMLAALGPADLAIVLVTGGGSALIEEPRAGVSLDDVIAVTRFLSGAGADIRHLNVVRQAVSAVKAGGLARACRSGRLLALVLSDIIGDPLDLIASGPCMPVPPDAHAALEVLRRWSALGVAPAITRLLESNAGMGAPATERSAPGTGEWTTPSGCRVSHVLLGTNATAVSAAAHAAAERGYEVLTRHATPISESANDVGAAMAADAARLLEQSHHDGKPRAMIWGGEATVAVPPNHGRGGRNQQTVLAAIAAWQRSGAEWPRGLLIESFGTDGEDGPTDAAGGCAGADTVSALSGGVDEPLARCDAYPALAGAGGLVVTGPTGTNVADVRIVLVRP